MKINFTYSGWKAGQQSLQILQIHIAGLQQAIHLPTPEVRLSAALCSAVDLSQGSAAQRSEREQRHGIHARSISTTP
jgi:hypothetical protein